MEENLKEIRNLLEEMPSSPPITSSTPLFQNHKNLYKALDLLDKEIVKTERQTRVLAYVRCSFCLQEDGHWSKTPWICDSCYMGPNFLTP